MNGSPVDDVTTRAFQYALENEKRIRSMLLKSARGNRDLAEEMFSEVALERLPRLFELHDGERPLDNYMLNNIRWYAFKYVNKIKHHTEVGEHHSCSSQSWHLDALENLSDLDRYLIEASVMYDMTYVDIAVELNWPIPAVRRALRLARQRVADMYEDDSDWLLVKKVIKKLCE